MATDFSDLFKSTDEQLAPLEATVTSGQIPSWLQGDYVRLGPGKFDIGNFSLNHFFDGFAVIYKFEIKNGKALFTKKFLQSDAYKKAVSVGKPVFTEFGTKAYSDPSKGLFSRMVSTILPDLSDNDAVNIFRVEDSVFVATETCNIRSIDIKTLETGEKIDLNKLLGVNLACSHALNDGKGTVYTTATSFTTGGKYHLIKIPPVPSGKAKDAFKKATIIADIPSSWSTSVSNYHSFGMSENYIVLIEQPMMLSLMKVVSIQVKGRSLRDCLEWNPNEMNRFIVIEKSTGKVVPVKYKTKKAFFIFHHINTYEEDGQLVVDIMALDSPGVVDDMFLDKLRNCKYNPKDPAYGRRFVLPLLEGKDKLPITNNAVTLKTKATAEVTDDAVLVTSEVLSPSGFEFPTINSNYLSKKYRYFYGTGLYDPGEYGHTLLKIDTATGDVKIWRGNEYMFPGEVTFVRRPDAISEDDGILLSAVTNIQTNAADFLLILDAKDLSEIARAEVTAHIPNVLHGIFIPH